MVEFERIAAQNAWWVAADAVERDPHVGEYERSPIRWRPRLLDWVLTAPKGIHVLRGPRQVGKTTLLKLAVRELVRKVPAREVAYLACDQARLRNDGDLADAVRLVLSRPGSKTRILFIDEVTYVKNWGVGLKVIADEGRLGRLSVVATGSNAVDVRRGGERMPGRRGGGLDLNMLPLDFRGYALAQNPGLSGVLPAQAPDSLSALKEASAVLATAGLEALFGGYLRSGGFPLPMREQHSDGEPGEDPGRVLAGAFAGDLLRLGRREEYARAIVEVVARAGCGPLNWRNLALDSGIGSHHTVGEYASDLEDLFIWKIVHHAQALDKPMPAFRKRRKIYFADPYLYWALTAWAQGDLTASQVRDRALSDPTATGALVQGVVGSHLFRRFGRILYWRKGERREIDFIVPDSPYRFLEVKYRSRVTQRDAAALSQAGGGILLTRNTFRWDAGADTIWVPVHVFLAALGSRTAGDRVHSNPP
jgi:predicted AAA+ superfamily ATPase